MTDLVSLLFIAMIPIDCKITKFPYTCLFTFFVTITTIFGELTSATSSERMTTNITVNNKSFEGEKFRGLLGSSGMRGKVSRFFHHHIHTRHSWFSNSTKQLRVFQRKLRVPHVNSP